MNIGIINKMNRLNKHIYIYTLHMGPRIYVDVDILIGLCWMYHTFTKQTII